MEEIPGGQICGVVCNTCLKMEGQANVTPMVHIHAAPQKDGVEILMNTANVLDAQTTRQVCKYINGKLNGLCHLYCQ